MALFRIPFTRMSIGSSRPSTPVSIRPSIDGPSIAGVRPDLVVPDSPITTLPSFLGGGIIPRPQPPIEPPTPRSIVAEAVATMPTQTPIIVNQPAPIPPAATISPAAIQDEINAKAQALATQMLAAQQEQRAKINEGGRIFKRFDLGTDVIENDRVFNTTGLFSSTINGVLTNAATMSVMFTGSLQTTANKQYYYDAWNANPVLDKSAEPQFAVVYGHRLGSGSSAAGTINDSPSRAIYSQYRLLLLNPEDSKFTFKDGTSTDNIYVINFNRSRIKEKVDPGNWQLILAQLSGSTVPNNVHTGSNVKIQTLTPSIISLIDDSLDTQEEFTATVGRVVNIVSGSILGGIFNPTAPKYYGLLYPDMGMIVLNGDTLNVSASFNTVTGSNINGDNAWKLFTSISGAMSLDPTNYSFQSRNSEIRTSAHYFVKVNNNEFNFSNNPSFVTGSEGSFSQPTFINDPKVYITSVGMYNDRQELLAVGKLSKAVQKSFEDESLIKVRLDY